MRERQGQKKETRDKEKRDKGGKKVNIGKYKRKGETRDKVKEGPGEGRK